MDRTFPFRKIFNPQTGRTTTLTGESSINNCLAMLLSTCKGELLGDPNFGTNLKRYLMNFKGNALYTLMKKSILESIYLYEPRVKVQPEDIYITKTEDENTVSIRIHYLDLTDGTNKNMSLTLNGDDI